MNIYNLSIFNHSGTLIKAQEMSCAFLPRTGEIISLSEERDNTTDFIVTEVTFKETKLAIFTPHVVCESFYKTDWGEDRLFYLRQENWIK